MYNPGLIFVSVLDKIALTILKFVSTPSTKWWVIDIANLPSSIAKVAEIWSYLAKEKKCSNIEWKEGRPFK